MTILIFIIITLLISICLSLNQIIWHNEQYYLEKKYPKPGTAMHDLIEERNEKMEKMIFSQFSASLIWSLVFTSAIFFMLWLIDGRSLAGFQINVF